MVSILFTSIENLSQNRSAAYSPMKTCFSIGELAKRPNPVPLILEIDVGFKLKGGKYSYLQYSS